MLNRRACLAGAVLGVGTHGARAETSQILQLSAPRCLPPTLVEGRVVFVYEIMVAGARHLNITALEVLAAETGALLAHFTSNDLASRVAELEASGRQAGEHLIYVELEIPAAGVPQTITHRATYCADAGGDARTMVSAPSCVGPAPIVLSPPLRGGPWAAIYHPAWPRGHRRVLRMCDSVPSIPGRFAIDWVKVDTTGAIADGDADLAPRHLGYGAEALAVADARVVAVRNDAPEPLRVSESVSNGLEAASGNYVILGLARECFAFYEHLMPGSVAVSPGERVARGQVVGSLGFTGDSTGPHLHFHLARTISPIHGDGIPFSIERFELLGRYHELETLGRAPWRPRNEGVMGARVRERPASNAVVVFA